jgi:hypothetical protein
VDTPILYSIHSAKGHFVARDMRRADAELAVMCVNDHAHLSDTVVESARLLDKQRKALDEATLYRLLRRLYARAIDGEWLHDDDPLHAEVRRALGEGK